jgi:hypothetical protein
MMLNSNSIFFIPYCSYILVQCLEVMGVGFFFLGLFFNGKCAKEILSIQLAVGLRCNSEVILFLNRHFGLVKCMKNHSP